mmetsp:Transcript_7052/g.12631  ORF Transcript_7052/g.12631 Transcript_7052/m.12631 type:complete len:97 (-) Transcript_7052:578-868(-)
MNASHCCAKMCASGRYDMMESCDVNVNPCRWKNISALPTESMNALCFSITPFGAPVVPDVYMITKRSSGVIGSGGWFALEESERNVLNEIALFDVM